MVTCDTLYTIQYFVGLSTDTKPGLNDPYALPNGSRFYEMDTQDYWIYDAETGSWFACAGIPRY